MPKGSPKKGSDKSSPKSKKSPNKGSPGSKSGKGGRKSPNKSDQEIPPIILKNVRRKLVWTNEGWPDYVFKEFRCPVCRLVLDTFPKFMAHYCWRKYYQERFHLGETQAFACRTCNQIHYSHADYASHQCNYRKFCYEKTYREVEEVLPITYPDHFDFYIAWARRIDWETKPHDPDWHYVLRCSKCSNKFKTRMSYLLHSCFQFALLRPADIRRLKTCIHCHFVFLNEKQYDLHVPYCREDRAFCIDLAVSLTELACQQFVLGRHCYEYDYHLHHGAAFKQREPGEPPGGPALPPKPLPKGPEISVNCYICGFAQPNLIEYFYHPCIAGKLITPTDLELILFCKDCHCLFTNLDELIEHSKACTSLIFTFVRVNTPELLRLALKRWHMDVLSNPYLPAHQAKYQCGNCKELFRWFDKFLTHPCPRCERYERLFIQPSALLETYVCHACHLVVFSISEAVSHSAYCSQGRGKDPKMIQIHYTMEDTILALTPWMRGPQLLQFDMNIGLGDWNDEIEYQNDKLRLEKGLFKRDCNPKMKASERIRTWLNERLERLNYREPGTIAQMEGRLPPTTMVDTYCNELGSRFPSISKFSQKWNYPVC